MRKTLLLVFIHGFKGGDDTFGPFPKHLAALIRHALPNVDVVSLSYPRFETRGELRECVTRFREWLLNKVIDIEVAHATPSPTIDPSVHTVLVGHSMGGIIAAETYLLLASETPITTSSSATNPETPNFPSNTTLSSVSGTSHPNPTQHPPTPSDFMFPHIQGILALDTPFLGLNPSMVAYGLEGGHKMASNAYSSVNEVASIFGWGSKSEPNVARATSARALPAPSATDAMADAAAAPKWQSWGKYAMFAGAAGAVAAGGAAALYSQREKISAGWGWASSHLLFIGDLARVEHLKKRVENLELACEERGAGCANLYSKLGKGAREGYGVTATMAGKDRTFCNLPKKVEDANGQGQGQGKGRAMEGMVWLDAINEKVSDETQAHMNMFLPRENPGYYALGEKAEVLVVGWVDKGWYDSSEKRPSQDASGHGLGADGVEDEWEDPVVEGEDANKEHADVGKDWHGIDGSDELGDVKMTDDNKDNEELEDSVIVDRSENGAIPLFAKPVASRPL